VLYATATYAAAALAARASRRPLVAKLVSDPAYERAVRYGLYAGPLEGLAAAPGVRLAALRRARTAALRTAARVTVPSAYLARLAAGFGLDPARVEVLPNPAPAELPAAPAPQPPGTLVFVGRLTRQKGLGTALAALARVPAARLLLVGEGPEREALEARARELGLDGRVAFLGALPRVEALALVAGAEAALLASDWENLPHAAVEALAVGTPVVATAVGGVPEVVDDGVNGLLVPPGDPEALARAVERVLVEPGLRERLAAAASPSVAPLDRDAVYGRLERILLEAAA
jgi:glycosyltransferase involved in cell wall biosynthesis